MKTFPIINRYQKPPRLLWQGFCILQRLSQGLIETYGQIILEDFKTKDHFLKTSLTSMRFFPISIEVSVSAPIVTLIAYTWNFCQHNRNKKVWNLTPRTSKCQFFLHTFCISIFWHLNFKHIAGRGTLLRHLLVGC